MKKTISLLILLSLVIILTYAFLINQKRIDPNGVIEILNKYPHDRKSFTQGLTFDNGFLYESSGDPKNSTLFKSKLETAKKLKSIIIKDEIFAEGITIFKNKIYQLSWKKGYCFVYDKETFKLIDTFKYEGEGWGITTDGENLIISDGSNILRFYDPETYHELKKLPILNNKREKINMINELEFINGQIWANIWNKDKIIIINPKNGELIEEIDFSFLWNNCLPRTKSQDLNGIAYDSKTNRIFITGKKWNWIFEIKKIK